ncbi:hypothetical protein H2200_010368 [Cladophialophora chaetospira]|uniref:Uncharacterized protein n=1 Tax=Cladophialophora chaetospira TaxID=386627 RepID=A0AA38X1C8_9EURO|nr:hypothetical protein H2200_010368 [Cladophialophora chaetospira]
MLTSRSEDAQILPSEVLLSIINSLPNKKGLKEVRFTSKAVACMVEPRLFDTVILVPYRDCLQDFARCMKENPRIAYYVQTLQYKVWPRYVGEMEALHSNHVEAMATLRRSGPSEKNEEEELSLIADCLSLLPSLRKIYTSEVDFGPRYAGTYISKRSHPYLRRISPHTLLPFRQCSSGDLTTGAQIAILALSQVPSCPAITELEMFYADAFDSFVDIPESSNERMATYRQFFSQLKTIVLEFQLPYPERPWARRWCHSAGLLETQRNIGTLLASARRVERLHFRGANTSDPLQLYKKIGPDNSWLATLLRNDTGSIRHETIYPNLKVLELGNAVCSESELTTLITSNRHKLQKLILYKMVLVKHPREQNNNPSWVQTFKAIRGCSIPEVRIYGDLSYRGSPLRASVEFAAVTHHQLGNEIMPSCPGRRMDDVDSNFLDPAEEVESSLDEC